MKLRPISSLSLGLLIATSALLAGCNSDDNNTEVTPPASKPVPAQVGERPLFLVRQMQDSALKTRLEQCTTDNFYRSEFSIGHRGAAMQFPEHTKESYQAAIDSGAGIVECDVTFTADKALVCRHSQCDLASTTNILAVPELANKCSSPFTPADAANGVSASATCCTSDITLAEFKTLKGKMEGSNPKATTAAEFINGTPSWRTDLYAGNGTLMTHAESIEMFKKAGVKMTPELKAASVSMPFDGFTQQDYAQKMLDEYTAAGVDASQVFPQSFILDDIKYWVANAPEFAKQAVFLDDRYDYNSAFDPQNSATWSPSMADLKTKGVEIIAPPLWVLVALDADKKIIPSEYAKAAKGAELKIITWSLERSGLLKNGGGFYYQSITEAIDNEGDTFELLDVLAKDVGVIG
ncbi:MAG TPA: glycerophosphodiester phosphodiesterase, partial [Shewanella baltica]|nr:glycerophosphodiester phosphodiesterase [Shewanella baltica]